MIIKKTLRNAAVGTLAAGAMILPAATTVAPQMQLLSSDCAYPDSQDTNTEQTLSRYVLRKGAITSTVTVSNLDGGSSPNGTITVRMTGPGPNITKSKVISGQETSETFRFGGFGKRKQGAYTFTATFSGTCRYSNSSDEDTAIVSR